MANSNHTPQSSSPAYPTYSPQTLRNTSPQRTIDFTEHGQVWQMLSSYLRKLKPFENIGNITFENTDSEFDRIVDYLYDVIDFCEQKGIPVTIEKGNYNAVNLIFGKDNSKFKFSFFAFDFSHKPNYIERKSDWENICKYFPQQKERKMVFVFGNKLYTYRRDMFKSAWEEYVG